MPTIRQKSPQARSVGALGIGGAWLDTAQHRAWMRDALARHALDQQEHEKK